MNLGNWRPGEPLPEPTDPVCVAIGSVDTMKVHATVGTFGYRFGVWAATPHVDREGKPRNPHGDNGWRVTHVPTGLSAWETGISRTVAVCMARRLAASLPDFGTGRVFGEYVPVAAAADRERGTAAIETALAEALAEASK